MGRPAQYPAEFRREAVALVESSGRPVAEATGALITDARERERHARGREGRSPQKPDGESSGVAQVASTTA
jgi:transposase-like protein